MNEMMKLESKRNKLLGLYIERIGGIERKEVVLKKEIMNVKGKIKIKGLEIVEKRNEIGEGENEEKLEIRVKKRRKKMEEN